MDCHRAFVKFLVPSSPREPVARRRGTEPAPPNFPSQPGHEDARSCGKKEKSLVTREVTM